MATLKTTVVDAISSLAAAVNPNDLVRKSEFDAGIEGMAPLSGVNNAISLAHSALTVPATNESLDFSLAGQALTGEVKLPDQTTSQAADTGLSEIFNGPHAAGDTISLAKTKVSNVTVKRRLIADHSDIATGVADTDYVLDSDAGTVQIMTGGNLVATGAQEIYVEYDCAEILDGPGLEIVPSGLQNDFGTGYHQVARGDHTHSLLHRAATANSGSITIDISISEIQEVSAEVRMADSSLASGISGIYVNTNVIATKASVDALDVRVTALEDAVPDSGVLISVSDTDSIDMTRNEETGEMYADAVLGTGLHLSSGIAVDYDILDLRYPVTSVGTGTPEGVVTGNIGHRFFQTDATDDLGNTMIKIWEKTENGTNTGWF